MNYDANSIQVLGDIEHIQLRRGMYIGEGDTPAQLISEIFDNAIDEVQAGFSSEVIITVDTINNIYKVRDFGRGIPHGTKVLENGEKKEVLEVLITKSNSGGKFDNSSYNYSSGLNGLGMTITNALSEFIHIISYRKGKFVEIYSNQGNNIKLTKGKTTEPDGTLVEFKPDSKFFKSPVIPVEFIESRCKIASALGFKSKLFIDSEEHKISSEIYSLITEDDPKVVKYYDFNVFDITNAAGEKMKVAMRYSSATNDRYFGYTNLIYNYMGGTHVQQLSKVISDTWENFINKHKNLKPDTELKKTDYLIGLRAICAVFISKPEFSSQTKEKLVVNKNYFSDLMSSFSKQLYKYLDSNLVMAQQLVKRFEEFRISQNNLLNRKEISSLIKISTDSPDSIRRRSVVSKLVECTSAKRDNTELIIVEGNSALGPYLTTRNKLTQAILPIRGKILNVTGKSLKDCIKNKEVCDIANSLGCGIGNACDANKSRYERVIISSDADVDGANIASLLLSVFVNLFPDMIRQGRVFISLPPLYCWGTSAKDYGWCNEVTKIPPNVKNVHRFKG